MREYGRRKFVFGPLALREFWEKERSQMSIDREPWKSIKAYLESIARREISWTGKYASSSAKAPGYLKLSEAQRSPEEHIQLLNKYLDAISAVIPSNPYVIRPTIYHPDLHRDLVEIDWQSIWAAPLILQARASRLIDYNGGIILHLPENFKQLDQDEKTHVRDQSITSLSELVSFAGNSWDDDIIPLREYLIRLERTTQQGLNETQDFWDMLEGTVDRTGWTTNEEDFEGAVDYFLKLRETSLKTLDGTEREEFELRTHWVLGHKR
ncbi:phosphotransferase enzyme family protein [Blastomyces dermatitidis ER-3]|uniref:Phosphotransferase enzyme family protein n=1 Tax=Ajellomyces dermatitidis (strain ER-3 / ATCC MYA-2586) TaxID=559297 RepID=A0ABP2EYX2_AJEDR|nr:phosphotransferase enzyme family protein [Blastomyces dermatitidis ER-3]EEQ89453.2 phosphotransferase enzyme family protein [Blastomyces dermatitidis ER-3]